MDLSIEFQNPSNTILPIKQALIASTCPACRAVSSIMCNITHRTFAAATESPDVPRIFQRMRGHNEPFPTC
jgi:hypothetical protein